MLKDHQNGFQMQLPVSNLGSDRNAITWRTCLLCFLIISFTIHCGSTVPYPRLSNHADHRFDARLVRMAKSYLGTPYHYGGMNRRGIDCSGLTCCLYRDVYKKKLPHRVEKQYPLGKTVPLKNIQIGDLVFFRGSGKRLSHVGVYIDDGQFIHATVSKGVILSNLEETYYKRRLISVKRFR